MVGRIISVIIVTIAGSVLELVLQCYRYPYIDTSTPLPLNEAVGEYLQTPFFWVVLGIGLLGFIPGLCGSESEQMGNRFIGLIFIMIGSFSACMSAIFVWILVCEIMSGTCQ
ncbi:MAG: hypothetical protein Q4C70_14015, partial [Planctomycetia bacterium]|nr:hypothetical protein [Planctomycetia bacterium]